MGFNAVDKNAPLNGQTVDANGSAQVMLYDQFGNPVSYQNKSMPSMSASGVPTMGLDRDATLRVPRVGTFGTMPSTSDVQLWHDAFEGSTINAFWTQSLTTMTMVQAAGVLTLNNSAISTASVNAIITTQRQFPKYPRNPLVARFRANLSANPSAHTVVELGFGAPSGVVPTVANGAFFRFTASGDLVAVLSYNGAESVSSVLLSQGSISTSSYYDFDIFVDDDFARFIVVDSSGKPVVDATVKSPVATPYTLSTSHTPTFARVYTDVTGGGVVVQLKLTAHNVQILDSLMNMPWSDQSALSKRSAEINPTAYTQTGSSMIAAPVTFTPSNTVGGLSSLGGEYSFSLATPSELPLSVFAFTIPSPYTFMLYGMTFSNTLCTSSSAENIGPAMGWLIVTNCASTNLSTGGGQQMTTGIWFLVSAAMTAGNFVPPESGGYMWSVKTPIACLPGTVLHIGLKIIVASTVTTPGAFRGSVQVDGCFV